MIKQSYSHRKADAKLNRKRNQADDRQLIYGGLNVNEKIALAKSRRGESKREIARLEKQLKKPSK